MRDFDLQRAARWSGALLITVVGSIHFILTPEHFKEAIWVGVLFLGNIGAAIVAALNISRDALWGWVLGALTAGGAFAIYILTRSVTLPRYEEAVGEWLETLGIFSLIVEASFVVLFLVVIATGLTRARQS